MRNYILLLAVALFLIGCEEEWLEVKRNQEQIVPVKAAELQALLDNTFIMNLNYPLLGEASGDDIFVTYDRWANTLPITRNSYIWAEEIYDGMDVPDWDYSYERIFYANTVLDGLDQLEEGRVKDELKGSACFFRALNHFLLAQIFCKQYDPHSANNDPGIPLRLKADINVPVKRASVQEVYDQVLLDAHQALALLPQEQDIKTRPGKAAANSLLSRVYLQMHDYENALKYTEAALDIQGELIDYNLLNLSHPSPFVENDEVIFQSMMAAISPVAPEPRTYCAPALFESYEENDLRKTSYFSSADGGGFKGTYSLISVFLFTGFATDELWLTAAECYARIGDGEEALNILNNLLMKRYVADTFEPLTATDAEEALALILNERRKELIYRGIRWSDLRRLNQEERFATVLTRQLGDDVYELEPNSARYVLPIPDKVINMSNIEQNER